MAWQRKDRVEEVVSPFLRDSAGYELVPELAPPDSEAVFDKLSMSAFEGTPLEFALRDAQVTAFAIVGVAMEVGLEPTVRHGADRGLIPVVVTDACGAENQAAAKRSLDALATAGDALLTDVSTITALLAPAAVTGPQLNRKLTRAIERNRNVRQYRSRRAVEDQHMSVDSVGSKPTRVLIVVANPATATTVGWPTRFWGAELTHPEGRSNGK